MPLIKRMISVGESAESVKTPGRRGRSLRLTAENAAGRRARIASVAIVTAGFVVEGGIDRRDFVAQAGIGGLMPVQFETGLRTLMDKAAGP